MKKDALTKQLSTRQPKRVEFELAGVLDHVHVRPINKFELAVMQEQIKRGFGVTFGRELKESPPYAQILAAAYVAIFALCEDRGVCWYDCGLDSDPKPEMIEEAQKVAQSFPTEILVQICNEFLDHNSEGIDSDEELEETRKNLQAIPSGDGN